MVPRTCDIFSPTYLNQTLLPLPSWSISITQTSVLLRAACGVCSRGLFSRFTVHVVSGYLLHTTVPSTHDPPTSATRYIGSIIALSVANAYIPWRYMRSTNRTCPSGFSSLDRDSASIPAYCPPTGKGTHRESIQLPKRLEAQSCLTHSGGMC
jgi:hypothetical protein